MGAMLLFAELFISAVKCSITPFAKYIQKKTQTKSFLNKLRDDVVNKGLGCISVRFDHACTVITGIHLLDFLFLSEPTFKKGLSL